MSRSVRRVEAALEQAGIATRIVEFPESTRTAKEAADAIGTTVGRIVKSLVFLAEGVPVVVLASGANRVDTERLGRGLGKRIERADAEVVRTATGFAIGGVAPLGYPAPLEVVVDPPLLAYHVVWAAACAPYAVFSILPDDLVRVAGGRLVDVK